MNLSNGSQETLMALIQLFRDPDFFGPHFFLAADVGRLRDIGMNDVISSLIVHEGTFTLFQNEGWTGFAVTVCKTGGPKENGEYPNPASLAGRNDTFSSILMNSHEPKVSSPIHPHD